MADIIRHPRPEAEDEPAAKRPATQNNAVTNGNTEKPTQTYTLKDWALYTVLRTMPGARYWHLLPELLRSRLPGLFKEPFFQYGIRTLNLAECPSLTDDEVRCVSTLKHLDDLDLSYDDHLNTYRLHYLNALPNLKTLRLNHCRQFAAGLMYMNSVNLTMLDIAFCEIEDPIMFTICRMTALENLNLGCNRLTDEGCVMLASLPNLKHLSLTMNPLITDKTLQALTPLKKLENLNLNFCKLVTSNGIEQLSIALSVAKGGSLKQLDMVGCDRALTDAKVRPLILLAEDSKVQARMIGMVLQRYNFDVQVAADGEMALEMFRANPRYDLILMDVAMPVMDGISCMKQIREYEAQHNLKRTPIIIQTADPRDSQKAVCIEAGCDEFLPKPLDKSAISLAKQLMEAKGTPTNHTSRV
ncbi:hypothetical protein PROFUN_09121 [Planoprotostelium fungivorum]|uniref:Response regulatory domain-containing protein n=1 Tax=Planoprotostelium fungivorum TaxID=1890364 RepID=A0A2P6NI09_9EUKA|nr:hypothetical protein PROFUN_09121 [Planoprotostelium fungivorum]